MNQQEAPRIAMATLSRAKEFQDGQSAAGRRTATLTRRKRTHHDLCLLSLPYLRIP